MTHEQATPEALAAILTEEGFVHSEQDGFWGWLSTSKRWGMTWDAGHGLTMFTNGYATVADVHQASNRMYVIEAALAQDPEAGQEGQ